MKYKIAEKEGIVIITPKGKMMAGPDLDELKDKIQELVRTGPHRLVIDLNRLTWMTAVGLRILVETFHSLKSIGGELKIANVKMSPTPGYFVEPFRFPWKIYDSAEEAVKSFQTGS